MKLRNQVKKYGSKAAFYGTTAAVSVTSALAAVPDGAAAEGAGVKADLLELGAYGIIASLVLMGLAYMRRAAK